MSQQKHSAFRKVLPRVDSRAIKGVKGDLLLLEGVKQPRYAEIVNVVLGDGEIRFFFFFFFFFFVVGVSHCVLFFF